MECGETEAMIMIISDLSHSDLNKLQSALKRANVKYAVRGNTIDIQETKVSFSCLMTIVKSFVCNGNVIMRLFG